MINLLLWKMWRLNRKKFEWVLKFQIRKVPKCVCNCPKWTEIKRKFINCTEMSTFIKGFIFSSEGPNIWKLKFGWKWSLNWNYHWRESLLLKSHRTLFPYKAQRQTQVRPKEASLWHKMAAEAGSCFPCSSDIIDMVDTRLVKLYNLD